MGVIINHPDCEPPYGEKPSLWQLFAIEDQNSHGRAEKKTADGRLQSSVICSISRYWLVSQ